MLQTLRHSVYRMTACLLAAIYFQGLLLKRLSLALFCIKHQIVSISFYWFDFNSVLINMVVYVLIH